MAVPLAILDFGRFPIDPNYSKRTLDRTRKLKYDYRLIPTFEDDFRLTPTFEDDFRLTPILDGDSQSRGFVWRHTVGGIVTAGEVDEYAT